MNSRDWADIKEIFTTALSLPAHERGPFLARLDQPIRDEVASLLSAYEEDSEILEQPLLTNSGTLLNCAMESQFERERIGRYRITGEIGRGGMGAVFRASLDDGGGREYAIKIIRPELNQTLLVGRFRQELRILQTLTHPFIPQVVDAGETDEGEPYFVMEFIDGLPVNEFCDSNVLGLKERLTLFEKICQAVGTAHRAGIIHRDLKPSNILVTRDGFPKLLDFGIAKIVRPEEQPYTVPLTGTMQHFLTPEYASPEQIRGETPTPASDAYSLGVLLYELLTGVRPYEITKRAPDALGRVLQEEVIKPSSRIKRLQSITAKSSAVTAELISAKRGTTPKHLTRRLRGKLDDIVMHALAKDPELRYQSAEQLANDIGRFRHNKPVTAPRQRLIGVVRSALSRNRNIWTTALAAACLVVITSVTYIRTRPVPFPPISVTKLTSSGNVGRVAISPDGKFLAYVLSTNQGDSLWIRERTGGAEWQLLPIGASFGALQFSPDSASLYFLRFDTVGGAIYKCTPSSK